MNNQEKMLYAASGAMKNVFELTSNDQILILTDTYCKSIANAFEETGRNLGCFIQSYEINANSRPLKEIPTELEKLLTDKTIVLNILKALSEEIQFRIKWIFKVKENKQIRMGHMPGINEAMMLGSVNVDYGKMKSVANSLIDLLDGAIKFILQHKQALI